MSLDNRRPIRSRTSGWAKASAAALAARGVSANAVSLASVVFAALAAASLLAAPFVGSALYLGAAVFAPLRLVANLLDGMIAVEHGKATPLGAIYNELPDRVSDVLIIAALGTAAVFAGGPAFASALGWLAAVLAVLTAYVRELGRALGAPVDFSGPFAKQQRMWVVVAAGLLAAFVAPGVVLTVAVAVLAAGTFLTALRRTMRLAAFLKGGGGGGG